MSSGLLSLTSPAFEAWGIRIYRMSRLVYRCCEMSLNSTNRSSNDADRECETDGAAGFARDAGGRGFCYTELSVSAGPFNQAGPVWGVSADVFGEWLSLVEHLVRDQGVGGSNPLSPTIFRINRLQQISRC